jgi:DHA3 family macrolide efflux protein-like MFS transporter
MATQFSIEDDVNWQGRFFTIWGGQALSLLGSQLVSFAIIWYLTIESGSATVLAVASMVGLLPNVILGPLVGPLVDRWNRRRIMIIADSIIAIATLALAYIFAEGTVEFWQIYLLLFIRAVASGFHGPSMSASTSLMVPVEHLTRIQGLNQMLNGGLNIISAPLGALLLEVLPLQGILAIDVVSALFAIAPLFFLDVPQPDRAESVALSGEEASFWADFKAGFRYVLSWKGLLIVALMASLINFMLTPAFSLVPLLVNGYFGRDAIAFGTMEALFGVGVIVGSLLLGVWGGFNRRIVTAMVALFGIGIGTLSIGFLPPSAFIWAVIAFSFVGFVLPIANGSLGGLLQATVAPDMQGRVFTLTSSLASGMSPIGLAIAGPVSDALGKQTWFIVGGVTCILMAVVGVLMPAVMNIEDEGSVINEKGREKRIFEEDARV